MKNIIKIFLLLFSILTFGQTGKVIGVKDGDTVVILDQNKNQHIVRIADIDCPEKNQPFGKKAKWFTSDQVYGKEVTIKVKSKENPTDRYGRIIGYVIYEGKNLSHELLKAGLAWHYKYYSKDKELAKLENEAKKNHFGLWADSKPIILIIGEKEKEIKIQNSILNLGYCFFICLIV